jgi:hypothetical protein
VKLRNKHNLGVGKGTFGVIDRIPDDDMPINWYWPMVVSEVFERIRSESGVRLSPEVSAYSNLLRERSPEVIERLFELVPSLDKSKSFAFIRGEIALGISPPFQSSLEKEELGEETARLLSLIYSWLLAERDRDEELRSNRYFERGNLTPLELLLVVDSLASSQIDIERIIESNFLDLLGFSPKVSCRVVRTASLTPADIFQSYCVAGWSNVVEILRRHPPQSMQPQIDAAVTAIVDQVTSKASNVNMNSIMVRRWGERSFAQLPGLFAESNPDCPSDRSDEFSDEWYQSNKVLFQYVADNTFKTIHVEDASRDLNDAKGREKDRENSILRVRGLQVGDDFIPASNLFLKLRGIPGYRSELNNRMDLLKEYGCYTYLHKRLRNSSAYLSRIGPMIFNATKIKFTNSSGDAGHAIGFLMEEISAQDGQLIFSCRVRRLTDFWDTESILVAICEKARADCVTLIESQLRRKLRDLQRSFWEAAVSVDYCDLMIFHDALGEVQKIMILDLERLSFSELVDEEHLILDTLVDVKTNLPKEHWSRIFPTLYAMEGQTVEYLSLREIQGMLRSSGRRRGVTIRLARLIWMLIAKLRPEDNRRDLSPRASELLLRWS